MFEVVGLIEVYLLDKLGSHSLVASHAPRAMGQQQFAAEDIKCNWYESMQGELFMDELQEKLWTNTSIQTMSTILSSIGWNFINTTALYIPA